MTEARRVKSGKWRIYSGPASDVVRDPQNGAVAYFTSLEEARRWWQRLQPDDPPLKEANKCAWCGAYFGREMNYTTYAGRYYHPQHIPQERNS
jgi:hypothetical protein